MAVAVTVDIPGGTATPLPVGTQAPVFELPSGPDQTVSLAEPTQ